MYGEFLKWHISQLLAPIEALFVASPLGFGGLHDDMFCCREAILLEVIKETATAISTCPYYKSRKSMAWTTWTGSNYMISYLLAKGDKKLREKPDHLPNIDIDDC